MLWVVTFETERQGVLRVPSVANDKNEAIEKARRIIPFVRRGRLLPFEEARRAYSWGGDMLVRELDTALRNLIDFMVMGGPDCRYDFLDGMDHYYETHCEVLRFAKEARV